MEEDSVNKVELLVPVPHEEYNKVYVEKILWAIGRKEIKNLAIVGGYGAGKSSIILQLLNGKQYNFKLISFLTVEKGKRNNNISSTKREKVSKKIQTEIFKQLYFGLEPNKLPKSKYFRIGKSYSMKHIVPLAIFSILSLIIGFTLINRYEEIGSGFQIVLVILFALFLIYVFIVLMRELPHLPIKKLGIFDLSTDLSDSRPDFEQMLDEIIYVFKRANYDVVIFEDLDRFENIEIMEELRQLNFILNNSLKRKITFIYAINDQLIGNTRDRVKLFDAIIPIIPVMSGTNVRDYVTEEFKDFGYNISENIDVLNVLAKYVMDLRELHYLAEIYDNYSRTVKNNLDEPLANDKILGLALLRCYYPKEVSLGNQRTELDSLFDDSARVWDDKVNELEKDAAFSDDVESGKYTFLDAIKSDFLRLKKTNSNETDTLFWDGHRYSQPYEEIKNVDFLDEIIKGGKELVLETGGYSSIKINREYIEKCSGSLSKYYKAKTLGSTYYHDRLFDFKTKTDRFSFVGNKLKEVDEKLSNLKDDTAKNNSKLNTNDLINKENNLDLLRLVTDLVKANMLDENYSLYLSKSLNVSSSKELQTFKQLYMRHGTISYNQKLSQDDVVELVKTLTPSDYSNPALYNIQLIDYLAGKHDDKLLDLIDQVKEDDHAKSIFGFLDAYCTNKIKEVLSSVGLGADTSLFNRVPVLYFIQKLASKYPVETISHILDNLSTSSSGAQTYYCLAAIYGVVLGSEVVFKNNYSNWFSINFNLAIMFDLGTKISYIMSKNYYAIPDLYVIANNNEAMKYIMDAKMFTLNEDTIRLFSDDQLEYMIKHVHLDAGEIVLIIQHISRRNIRLFDALCERPNDIFKTYMVCDEMCKKVSLLDKSRRFAKLLEFAPYASEEVVVNELMKMNFLPDKEIYQIINSTSGELSKIKDMPRRKLALPITTAYEKICNFLKKKGIITSFRKEDANLAIRVSANAPDILESE